MFSMYDLCHPSYYKISQLGCIDGMKITTAFYVYIELCEVKRLRNVIYKYNKEIDIIYLEGKKRKSSEPEIYVPWPIVNKISLAQIESIQENLKTDRFNFVFRGGDSTCVYFRVTSGIIKPLSPDETKLIKQKEEKKFELEQEIRRNTSILYELAKSINSNEEVDYKSEGKNLLDEEKSVALINKAGQGELELESLTDQDSKETNDQVIQVPITKDKEIKITKDKEIKITKDKEIQITKDEEIKRKIKIIKDQNISSQAINTDVEMIAEIPTETPDIEMLPTT